MYGGILSRFDLLKNRDIPFGFLVWGGGGGRCFFSNSLKFDFFSDKVKAFI